nr:MAG TPA: hypothetical protein [Caudoviricetes sp.]
MNSVLFIGTNSVSTFLFSSFFFLILFYTSSS